MVLIQMKKQPCHHRIRASLQARTRKCEFLNELGDSLVATAGKTGRPPFATEVMLRIHLLQQFFGYSDPVIEEALHDISSYL